MFKKSLVLLIVFTLFMCLTGINAFAKEKKEKDLSKKEIEYLLNYVGLTEEMIADIPLKDLRILIEEEAVLVSQFSEVVNLENSKTEGDIGIFQGGDLDESKIKLDGYAYDLGKVASGTYKGYKRLKFYGKWEWLSAPANTYVDAFAVGWGDTRILVPTANGDAAEFQADYYRYDSTRGWYLTENTISTNNFEPNAGTGWTFDIRQGLSKHKGTLTQYAYTRATSADVNFKFTYGHAYTVVNPSFSASQGYFSVDPGVSVKVGYAAGEIKW